MNYSMECEYLSSGKFRGLIFRDGLCVKEIMQDTSDLNWLEFCEIMEEEMNDLEEKDRLPKELDIKLIKEDMGYAYYIYDDNTGDLLEKGKTTMSLSNLMCDLESDIDKAFTSFLEN